MTTKCYFNEKERVCWEEYNTKHQHRIRDASSNGKQPILPVSREIKNCFAGSIFDVGNAVVSSSGLYIPLAFSSGNQVPNYQKI